MNSSQKLVLPAIGPAKIALYSYILSITLLPIGFGGARDLPLALSQIGLAISAIALVFEKTMLQQSFWPKRIQIALALFACVLAWGFLQTQSFMPSSWHHPLWQEAAKHLNTSLDGSIALWREEAFFSINRLITYIAAGILAYVLAQDTGRAKLMLQALWYSGIALCIYGYFNEIIGSNKVLWADKTEYQGDLTSTFINKNHFAIYVALVLLSGCMLLYQSWRNALRDISSKKMLKGFFSWAKDKGYVQFFLLLYVFGAILLSHGRSALILSMIGIASFFVCYQIYAKQWKNAVITLIIALCFSGFIIVMASQLSEHFARLFMDQSANDRLDVYKICFAAIADNPWLGYGMGSFQAVFRLYNETVTWSFNRAHSDFLESLVDLGLPIGLTLWSAVGLLLSGLIHGILKRRRHGAYPALAIAACIIVLCHSAMDFSLQIPGVAMPFAMLLGIGLAQSWGSSEKA